MMNGEVVMTELGWSPQMVQIGVPFGTHGHYVHVVATMGKTTCHFNGVC